MKILKNVHDWFRGMAVSAKAWHHRKYVLPKIETENRNRIRDDLRRGGYDTLRDWKRLSLLATLTDGTYREFREAWRANICGIQNHYGSTMTWFPTSKTLFQYEGNCVDGSGRRIDGWEGKTELNVGEKFAFSVYSSTYDHNRHEVVGSECHGFDDFESAMRCFLGKSVPKRA